MTSIRRQAQNIANPTATQAVDDHGHPATPLPTPVVKRAWAYELAADGSGIVPPPPPPKPNVPPPNRDPVVIELGAIEVGTRIEILSLSDNPSAHFDKKHAAQVIELPLTGYNVAKRTATISLNQEQMKEKGIVAGERLILRQVGKDGSASEPVHVFLDPSGWATETIREPLANGNTHDVRGGKVQINTGITGLVSYPNPGKLETVLGKVTTDSSAPKLLEGKVSVERRTLSKAHAEWATALLATGDHIDLQLIKDPNAARKKLGEDRLALYAVMEYAQALGKPNSVSAVLDHMKTGCLTVVKFDHALEPGATAYVENSRTGETVSRGLGQSGRKMEVLMTKEARDGDPFSITYTDGSGNAGKPYYFNCDSQANNGKKKWSPLDVQLVNFSLQDLAGGGAAAAG